MTDRPVDRISAAYQESGNGRARQDNRIADSFKRDETFDGYLALRESDPERFARLPHETRLAAGHYAEMRSAAERVGRDG